MATKGSMRLDNKVALVSGGAQGIGRAVALRLAQEGADIALNVLHDDERAASARAEIEALGRRCAVLQADVSQVAEVRAMVAEGVRQLGRLDVLVNNAGVEKRADFLDVSEAHYDHVMGVNLKGAFFLTQAFVAHLKETQRPGKVINMSSVHEELPFPHFTAYCCSKGGMQMMMRNLAVELAPLGITVNNIAPGAIETPINATLMKQPALVDRLLANIPLRRLGQPEDVAGVAAFLASAEADYITGATIVIDGGLLWNYSEQ
ncbi:SDR family NAD(P)-dependent oxidoreductase [Methylibium sp.]|uniref:SDR family NAD(P)-dependent oxidoreductase n=1 Tax=Methylibium sp. TaxID=2067992 RepID=UPI0025F9DCEE|nr:glucose 1-dehydrogenase [Methylibium sp.]